LGTKKPSNVKGDRETADFILSLDSGCHLSKIIKGGLETLRQNMFAGERIEKDKLPKYYVMKYGINNLYKLNLDSKTRLSYTLVADEKGIAVIVLEIMDHKKYNERFGYKQVQFHRSLMLLSSSLFSFGLSGKTQTIWRPLSTILLELSRYSRTRL